MRKFISLLITGIIAFSCTPGKKEGYTINGTVKGADTGMVYLLKFTDKWEKADSVNLKNGSFTFSGKVDMPEFCQIKLSGKNVPVTFFIENADMKVNVDADSIQLSEVKGSSTHDLYLSYVKTRDSIDAEVEKLGKKWDEAKTAKDSAAMADLEKKIDSTEGTYKNVITSFVDKNPGSVVGPYLVIRNAWQFELPDLENLLTKFDTVAKKSVYAQAVEKRADILRKVQIGQTAPDFTMNNANGEPVSLSSFKGKYLLVDFWASWCGPCRHENPNVVAAYNNFKGKGFDVLGVSFDKDKEKWDKAVADDHLTWNHVSDLSGWDNAAGKIYGINSIPANVLLDPEQKIIGRNLRGDDLNKKLVELFGNPAEKKSKGRKK